MYEEIPKPVRRQMNALVSAAHEAALRKALEELDRQFDRWRRGEIDPFELKELIHKFHNGTARQIFNQFGDRRNSTLLGQTAYAVAAGLVNEKQVPPDVVPYIERSVQFYK